MWNQRHTRQMIKCLWPDNIWWFLWRALIVIPLIDKYGLTSFDSPKIFLFLSNFSDAFCAYRFILVNLELLLVLSTKIIRYCPVKGTLSFALYAFDFTLVTIPVLMSFSTHSPLCFETSSMEMRCTVKRRQQKEIWSILQLKRKVHSLPMQISIILCRPIPEILPNGLPCLWQVLR